MRLTLLLLGMALASCTVAPPCERNACAGCCSDDGECLAGVTFDACGAASQQCARCLETEACIDGACRTRTTLKPDTDFAGTLWLTGALVDPLRLDVARLTPRLGVSQLVTTTRAEPEAWVLYSSVVSDEGDRVARVEATVEGRRVLTVTSADGQAVAELDLALEPGFELQRVVHVSASSVIWLNQRREVLVTRLPSKLTVRATPEGFTTPPGAPLWLSESADHRFVAVVSATAQRPGAYRVWVTDTVAWPPMQREVLTAAMTGGSATSPLGADGAALFTDDGRVLFKARFDHTSGLLFARPDGERAWRLLEARVYGAGEPTLVAGTPSGWNQLGGVGLSPDTKTLAFSVSAAVSPPVFELYAMPSDGSLAPRRIGPPHVSGGPRPEVPFAFSPDGRHLAFTANWQPNGVMELMEDPALRHDVYLANLKDRVLTLRFPVGAGARVEGPLLWSPDGEHLGFLSDHEARGHAQLYFVDAFAPRDVLHPAWPLHPQGRVLEARWTR